MGAQDSRPFHRSPGANQGESSSSFFNLAKALHNASTRTGWMRLSDFATTAVASRVGIMPV